MKMRDEYLLLTIDAKIQIHIDELKKKIKSEKS